MKIHESAIVEDGVELGEGCEIAAFAVVKRGTVLGAGVKVDHHAVIGGDPQDLSFDSTVESGVVIGSGTTIREGVTVHRSTQPGGKTRVGDNCYLMACSHVGHDVVVGDRVVLANSVLLAGHVVVGDFAFLSGGGAFHQFVRVGEGVMVSGNARITMDVPPFIIAHERNKVSGLNLLGLKRRGFAREVIRDIKSVYKTVYRSGSRNLRKNAEAAVAETDEGKRFLEFFQTGQRGFMQHD